MDCFPHYPQIGDFTNGFYPYYGYNTLTYKELRDTGAMDYYMTDSTFFNGGVILRVGNNILEPVTDMARQMVINWIDNYFKTHYIPYDETDWVPDFQGRMLELDMPFWAGIRIQNLWDLDELLNVNGLKLIRRQGQSGTETGALNGGTNASSANSRNREDDDMNRTISDNSNHSLSTSNAGARTSTSSQSQPSHSVSVASNFPPNSLNITGTVNAGLSDTSGTLNNGNAPNTNWNYASSMAEDWATGGQTSSTTNAVTDTGDVIGKNYTLQVTDPQQNRSENRQANIANNFVNNLGYQLANARNDEQDITQGRNPNIWYQMPYLIKSLTENLPFDMLKRELGKMFIQVW